MSLDSIGRNVSIGGFANTINSTLNIEFGQTPAGFNV